MTKNKFSLAKAPRVAMMLSLVSVLALQACDEQIMLTEAGNDPTDSCVAYRQTISAARRTEINQQADNAIAGAVFGAILGAAIAGGDASDRRQGALIGALGGGLAGFSGTYYQQQAQRAADANALLASVNQDAGQEISLLTQTGTAAQQLRTCRSEQIASLGAQVRAGQVQPAVARGQLATIRARLQQDNQIISAAFNGIGQRVDAYIDATAAAAQVERNMVTASATPAARATPNVARVSTQSQTSREADAQAAARIDREIDALQVLLG